jgi:predicted DNA-binding transcriptional regulator AlpA
MAAKKKKHGPRPQARPWVAKARAAVSQRVRQRKPFIPPDPPPTGRRLILKQEMLDKVKKSYSFVFEEMKRGRFPAAVSLGRQNGWWEDEVNAWLESLPRLELKRDEEATM